MIEVIGNNWYKDYMNEREQEIVRTYQEFRELGAIEAVDSDEIDPETAHDILVERVNDFENDIGVAYEKDKTQTTSSLTKHAFLGLMIEGASEEELKQFIDENGLSAGKSVAVRREDTIKAVLTVHDKAEKAREQARRQTELLVGDNDFQSLDDTLSRILARGGLRQTDQGAMRLLFGLVVLRDDQASLGIITQMKSNAAGLLRHRLTVAKDDFGHSPRAVEGEGILHRIVHRSRTGYPTIQTIAETIAYDKEAHTKAVYTDNIERNQMMIETFVSSALNVMYPEQG